MFKVSILIPCYNAERWVAQAIQSALDQTHGGKEVIVVDDGSTDGSLDIIKSFGDQIHWETGPNRGGNVARNRLLDLATGEWLQYLDADDYLLPEKIERQLQEMGNEQADVLWSPSIYEFYEGPDNTVQEKQAIKDEDAWIALIRWRLPQTGASLWRKQAIIDAGGWKADQARCQEHELYLRLLQNGSRFQFCSSDLSIYRQWSTGTVCRHDPIATVKTRMGILDTAETFLRECQRLSHLYENELFATRVQCARSEISRDPDFSSNLVQKAIKRCPHRNLPSEPWFPTTYRLLFRLLGFRFAEAVATVNRIFCSSVKNTNE